MQLVRTLALAAAAAVLCAGRAAAQDTPAPTSPAPPSAAPNPTTPAPSTTPAPGATPAPAATTTAPPATGSAPSTGSTPGAAPSPAAESIPEEGGFTRVQIKSASSNVVVNIDTQIEVVADGSKTWTNPVDTRFAKMRVIVDAATTRLEMNTLKSDQVKELEIGSYEPTRQAVLGLPTNGLEGLASLSSLTLTNIDFSEGNVRLTVPKTLAYLKINGSNTQDLWLKQSGLNKVDLVDTNFTQLPFFLYQFRYSGAVQLNQDFRLNGRVTELSAEEFANAQDNLKSVSPGLLRFENSCSDIASADTASGHVVCLDKERTGVRSFGNNARKDTTRSGSGSFTDAPTGPTPAPTRARNSSSNTTLTVIVIVIAAVAAVLAYFVARRYFCTASSLSGSPRLNERTVGLISKDESHAANNKLSFISSDDALRQIRLEQQDVSVTKSVGTGRLWVGDFAGRKVMIKRIEAESSDSYATKALITQARALAPLTHPNLVSLVGVTWVQGTDFGVVGEFMDKGTLKAVLMDLDTELDLQSKLHMCLDIAQALKYLHSSERNMYMKRLTSRKVLVNGAVECKLNLYECHPCTTKIEYPEVFGAGEMAWLAPELITRTGVLDPRKINIFSLGVLIGEIMTRASPYQSAVDAVGHTLADLELLKRIKRQERLLPHENRHEFTELPAVLRDLVDRCLSYQPLSRPTADEIVQCLESVKDYSERVGSTTSL